MNPDTLQPVFYPSCVVNFRLRFDERYVFTVKGAKAFSYTSEEMLKKPLSPEAASGIPLFLTAGKKDKASFVFGRIPKKASVELPAFREAGKFSLTFDYRDLPIDPRLLRSCGVEIFLDTVAADNFARGVTQSEGGNGVERPSVLSARTRHELLASGIVKNLAMVGVVDSWKVSHSASGSEISMEGRDLRAVLMNSPLDPKMLPKLKLKQPIDDVVRTIVGFHPFGQKMDVLPLPADQWPGGVIPSPAAQGNATAATANASASSQTRVRQGAAGKDAKVSAGAQPDKLTLWDLITRYCQLVGAVPYYEGETLKIAPARSLYSQLGAGTKDNPAGDTPFYNGLPRNVNEPQPLSIRRLVFGRNIASLNFERKFNGFVARTIEVVSLDTSSTTRGAGKLIVVRWPDKPTPKTPAVAGATTARDPDEAAVSNVAPSGEVGDKDKVRISVPGINDRKKLLQIAQDIYEELGRGEQGGSVETKSLASFGAGNEDPDLLRLRPGDAVELLVSASSLTGGFETPSPLTDQSAMSASELAGEIYKRLGDENLADAIVATSRNLVFNLQNYFRAKNVKFDWDIKSGVSVSFDFHNFVESRNAITPIPQPTGAKGPRKSTGSRVRGG